MGNYSYRIMEVLMWSLFIVRMLLVLVVGIRNKNYNYK
jgi:hypothetical protein